MNPQNRLKKKILQFALSSFILLKKSPIIYSLSIHGNLSFLFSFSTLSSLQSPFSTCCNPTWRFFLIWHHFVPSSDSIKWVIEFSLCLIMFQAIFSVDAFSVQPLLLSFTWSPMYSIIWPKFWRESMENLMIHQIKYFYQILWKNLLRMNFGVF